MERQLFNYLKIEKNCGTYTTIFGQCMSFKLTQSIYFLISFISCLLPAPMSHIKLNIWPDLPPLALNLTHVVQPIHLSCPAPWRDFISLWIMSPDLV